MQLPDGLYSVAVATGAVRTSAVLRAHMTQTRLILYKGTGGLCRKVDVYTSVRQHGDRVSDT